MVLGFISLHIALILMWIAVIIVAVIVEMMTTDLSSIWAALGAFVAMIVAIFVTTWWIQLVVFIVITLLGLILVKPYIKRYVGRNEIRTNSEALVGKTGTVTADITDGGVGAVHIDGKEWSAVARDTASISKGAKVEILAIEGVKLIVKEIVKQGE